MNLVTPKIYFLSIKQISVFKVLQLGFGAFMIIYGLLISELLLAIMGSLLIVAGALSWQSNSKKCACENDNCNN